MATAANYDLTLEQGATHRFTVIFGYKDGTVDSGGNPILIPYDLTNCKIRMQIRQKPGSDVLIAATTTNGGIVIDPDPTTGRLTVTLTDEATDSLKVSRARYDIEIGFPSGDVLRVLQGAIKIDPAITRGADFDDISTGALEPFDVAQQDVDMDTLVTNQPSTA